MIIVEPLAGLSNKLRVIESAYNLAKKFDKKLFILWNRNAGLNANYTDLFDPIDNVFLSEAEIKRFNFRNVFIHGVELICHLVPGFKLYDDVKIRSMLKNNFDFNHLKKDKVIFIKTCMDFYKGDSFNLFKLNEVVESRIENKILMNNIIGIHIRRGDNTWSTENSPTELFLNKCNDEISNDPNIKFYLSTDDRKTESQFLDLFNERILIHKKNNITRGSKEGMIDAVIDLYNLSNCKKIYGSYRSSFSDMAAEIGKTEKIILNIK